MEPDDEKTRTHVPLAQGVMVSHYRIVEKIGAGGMGEVYLAEDTELDRKIALKFLSPHLCQDDDCRARFKREAQAAAKLSHPNIIHVYEVSEYQGRPFFAMEHVEGRSIKEFSSGKDLSIEQILELGLQICEGLHAAHEKGVTHRDIKPSNILIDSHGRAKIVDFGLASVVGKDHLTKTGSTLGTIGYMSPEQVQGKVLDHRSDLFSLGVILYELITRQNPFMRDTEAATLKAVVDDASEPLARFKREVPESLELIVSKLLEKNPEHRYQSAAGVVSDFRRLKRDSDIALTPHPPGKKSRAPLHILLPVVFVILITAALVLKPWQFYFAPTQEVIAFENRLLIMNFDNLTDPADSLKLGEIISSLLIADLGNSDYLQVVSRQRLYDILKLLGHEKDRAIDRSISSEVARRASASSFLSGNILQAEPVFLVTYEVTSTGDGHVMASGRITGEQGQTIFDVADQLTVAVKAQMRLPGEASTESDLPVSQITSSSPEAYRFYLEGLRQIYEVKFDSAAISLSRAISTDTDFVMAYFYLSTVGRSRLLKVGALESAIARLDRVSKREKLLIQARYAAYVQRDRNKARQLLESLWEKTPDDKLVTFWLCILFRDEFRDMEMSKHYAHEAIRLDSTFKLAYNTLAYIYGQQGQYDSSFWAINEYIRLAPDEPNPYDTRGDLYRFRGDLSKAIESYQKALQIDSSFDSKYKLAETYLFTGNIEKADSINLELATSGSRSERAENRLRLTLALEYRGKIREALRKVDVLIETDKMEMGTTHWIMAKVLKQAYLHDILGEPDSSVYLIEKACDGPIDSLGFDVQAWLAFYYYKTGRTAEAERIQSGLAAIRDKLKDLDQTSSGETALLGFVNYARGDYEEALDLFEEARQAISSSSDYQWFPIEYFSALALYEKGNLGDAVEQLKAVLNCYDLDRAYHIARAVLTHYWLGRAYEDSGWRQKAIEQYERFLDIWKDADPEIKELEDARLRLAELKSKA